MTGPAPDIPLVLPAGIAITSISLRQLHYEEVGEVEQPNSPPVGQTLFDMFTSIDVRPPDFVQVSLKVTVRTNPKERPITLVVVVSAVFIRAPSVTIDQFAEFLRTRSQQVIFPYVREVVSSVTARGLTGALYINPVVLEPFMTLEEMKAQIAGLEPPAITNTPARAAAG